MAVFRRKISIEILKIDSWNLLYLKDSSYLFSDEASPKLKGIHFKFLFYMSAENMLCRHNAVHRRRDDTTGIASPFPCGI